jgi:hypothetical protein
MKLFSVEEANALLPTVRRIVARIAHSHSRVASLRDPAQRAAEGAAQSGGGFMQGGAEYVRALTALVENVSEIETLGVQIKDYTRGLIDFPTMRDGRIVLLCWELGEGEQIEWWHDVETGYAGRQPL